MKVTVIKASNKPGIEENFLYLTSYICYQPFYEYHTASESVECSIYNRIERINSLVNSSLEIPDKQRNKRSKNILKGDNTILISKQYDYLHRKFKEILKQTFRLITNFGNVL